MAFALVNQGFAALSQKQHDRAIDLLRQALRRLAELEFRDVIGYCFEGLAAVLAFTDAPRRRRGCWAPRRRCARAWASGSRRRSRRRTTETVEAVRSALAEARFGGAWRQGRELPLEDAIAYALEEESARIQR